MMPRIRRVFADVAGVYARLTTGGSGTIDSPCRTAATFAIFTVPSVFCSVNTRPTTGMPLINVCPVAGSTGHAAAAPCVWGAVAVMREWSMPGMAAMFAIAALSMGAATLSGFGFCESTAAVTGGVDGGVVVVEDGGGVCDDACGLDAGRRAAFALRATPAIPAIIAERERRYDRSERWLMMQSPQKGPQPSVPW